MSTKKLVLLKRKRTRRTHYNKRLKLLKSGKPRVVIRKSLKNILVQLVEYKPEGDHVILSVSSREIAKLGWKYSCGNIPAAYLTGLLFGKNALKKKIKNLVPDLGLYSSVKGSRLYAALKGLLDAGLSFPHSEDIFSDEGRITGKHIVDYANKLKAGSETPQFSAYLKKNLSLADLPKNFEEVKLKILGS